MPRFVKITPETKYAVGIDFGHGECSAAFCEIGWEKANSLLENPQDIRLYGNDKFTIPSAYIVTPEGEMLVGHSAISNIKGAQQFKISFKKRPSEMDEDERSLYSKYLGLVHRHIINRSGKLLPGNYVVFLSCPSGWDTEDRELFHDMAKASNIPAAGIWTESRAGLFSNMENQSDATRALMREGCILADIGSSTVDFSYLNGSLGGPIVDFGIQDGAQVLDMMLYYYILSLPGNETAKELVGQKDMKWLKDVLVYTCRTAKERFFSSEAKSSLNCNFDFQEICFDEEDMAGARFRCNRNNGGNYDAIMNLFMGGLSSAGLTAIPDEQFAGVDWEAVNNGYFSVLARRLNHFVKEHVKNNPVKIILLSGGASYMFLSEQGQALFRESILNVAFPDSPIAIGFDGLPSTSVSRGICSLGRAYARYIGCRDDEDVEVYESLQTKIEKTLNYHVAAIELLGTRTEKQGKDTPPAENQEKIAEKLPFSESAKFFIHALADTDTSITYNNGPLRILHDLRKTVKPEQAMPAVMTQSLSDEYGTFLWDVIAKGSDANQIVAGTIAETVMPIIKDYIDNFNGKTLQDLRDGLAKVIEERYKQIAGEALESAKIFIRENLEIERNYVSALISLYTASLQKDFMLDSDGLNEIVRVPSVDEILDEINLYEVVEIIATILLSFTMIIISCIVCSIFLGIPYLVSYLAFGIKEKNWSIEDWTEWQFETFMLIDFSKVKLFRPGRAAIRKTYAWTYEKNKQKMKKNICKTLSGKQFGQSVSEAFLSLANISKGKYINAVNNLFI